MRTQYFRNEKLTIKLAENMAHCYRDIDLLYSEYKDIKIDSNTLLMKLDKCINTYHINSLKCHQVYRKYHQSGSRMTGIMYKIGFYRDRGDQYDVTMKHSHADNFFSHASQLIEDANGYLTNNNMVFGLPLDTMASLSN